MQSRMNNLSLNFNENSNTKIYLNTIKAILQSNIATLYPFFKYFQLPESNNNNNRAR